MSKRAASTLLAWAALLVVFTGLLSLAPLLGGGFGQGVWQDAANFVGIVVFGGLLAAAALYLGHVVKSQRSLKVAEEELGATEQVLKQTLMSIVHYRTGRAWRFWEAAGGKLFLTSSRLIFRAHAGQPWRYELVIPLAELAGAAPCRIVGLPNGLTVERIDGTKELFGCGMESVEEWVSAITVLRTMGPMVEGRGGERPRGQENAGVQQTPRDAEEGYKEDQM
jgi:hypothetical protein